MVQMKMLRVKKMFLCVSMCSKLEMLYKTSSWQEFEFRLFKVYLPFVVLAKDAIVYVTCFMSWQHITSMLIHE